MQTLESANTLTFDRKLKSKIYLYIGLNYGVLKEIEKAKQAFVWALIFDPIVKPNPQQIKPSLTDLFYNVRAQPWAVLSVLSDKNNASVIVNNKLLGTAPTVIQLPLGEYDVLVKTPQGKTKIQKITLTTVEKKEITFYFDKKPLKKSVPLPIKTKKAEPQPIPQPKRFWTWIAAGSAAAVFAAYAGVGIRFWQDYDKTYDLKTNFENLKQQEEWDQNKYDNLKGDLPKLQTAANVLFGIASGLAVTSVVLYFVEGRPPKTTHTLQNKISIAPILGTDIGMFVEVRY